MKQFFLGLIGAVLGAFIPCASYTLARYECSAYPWLWALVVGGFLFSSFTVYEWAGRAFGHPMKALGFVILTEGVLVLCHTQWLAVAGLVILAGVNAVATAFNMSRFEAEPETKGNGITTLGIGGYTPLPLQKTRGRNASSTDRVRRYRERQKQAKKGVTS